MSGAVNMPTDTMPNPVSEVVERLRERALAARAENTGTGLGDALAFEEAADHLERLDGLINSPHTADWLQAVPLEAAHQIERWGAEHDTGKTPWDWFWLIGYLAQKAAASALAGDAFKAKHHTISTGAALLNWHRAIAGETNAMRPGIDPVARGIE